MSGSERRKPVRRFTGYHMTAILVAFFGLVIGVNAVMATFAVRTFGGKVVENSYVASQRFNGWLAEARAESRLGWAVSAPARAGEGIAVVIADASASPLSGATVTMRAEHPLGRAPQHDLRFREIAPGRYESIAALPSGRWKLRARIERGRDQLDLAQEIAQ